MTSVHAPWVEPSPSPGDVRKPGLKGWRARCSCGWVGMNRDKKANAQGEGIAHMRKANGTGS